MIRVIQTEFNFETMEGDCFAVYSGIKGGGLGLFVLQTATEKACHLGRQTRFEHGKAPKLGRYKS